MLNPNPSTSKNRDFLQEISVNTLQHRKTTNKLKKKLDLGLSSHPISKKSTTSVSGSIIPKKPCLNSKTGITTLPNELMHLMLSFLTPREILYKVQCINKEWYRLTQHPYFWKILNSISPLEFEYKYSKEKKIVERRSKGKLYIARNRLTNENSIVRKVLLDVTNSEKDDGIPTSVLREVSYLSSLNNPRVGTVAEVQVQGNLLLLAYPYNRLSLKEYMRQFTTREISGPRTPRGGRYNMPLPKVKVI